MIASSVKRCLRSAAASNAIAPSMAAVFRASFFRGKWQTIPTHFRYFSTSDSLQPWLHLPMEACVRDPRFDQTFKILLGEEGAERRAISFLNAVLRLKADGDRIKHIQFLDRSLYSLDNRAIHFDVKIRGCAALMLGTLLLSRCKSFASPPTSIAGFIMVLEKYPRSGNAFIMRRPVLYKTTMSLRRISTLA